MELGPLGVQLGQVCRCARTCTNSSPLKPSGTGPDAFWLQASAVAKTEWTNHRPAGAGRHASKGLAASAWLALALGDFAPGKYFIFSDWGV